MRGRRQGKRTIVALVAGLALVAGSAQAGQPATKADKNCSDFQTQPQAQRYFDSHGGSPSNDVDGLDRDHDGVACEDLPQGSAGGGPTTPSRPPALFKGKCKRGAHPDAHCTPGKTIAGVTAAQVCTPGYSEGVRNVPQSEKNSVYAEYGIRRHSPGSYEVDHLISLELGGSNSIKNLWPEKQPGARSKDKLENSLHRQVCDGEISLRTAQRRIVRWWRYA
jgi:excalibur calcium-binding domain-containing protein